MYPKRKRKRFLWQDKHGQLRLKVLKALAAHEAHIKGVRWMHETLIWYRDLSN